MQISLNVSNKSGRASEGTREQSNFQSYRLIKLKNGKLDNVEFLGGYTGYTYGRMVTMATAPAKNR